jgi:tetrapyrrole methylase family protein/MazG family protein
MVAVYLIQSGLSPFQALTKIRSLCPEAINEEEERFLQELPFLLMEDCEKPGELFEDLLSVMRILRQKCPWDRQQTAESLSKYLIEESWELNAAIKEKSSRKIVSELGDVLLQIVFHAVIGEEKNEFTISEVIKSLKEKLIRRHPHVFSTSSVSTPQGVEKQWEELKEKEERTRLEKERRYMPALMRAERIQESASHNGFDWVSVMGILEKVKEETTELENSLNKGKEKIAEEIGDLFFTLVNLSRFLKINPEEALHEATDKFLERYERALEEIRQKGLEPSSLSPEELDVFWNESKRKGRIKK